MSNPAGSFIWYELMTSDATSAAAFYGKVVGWKIGEHPDPLAGGVDYRMIERDDGGLAGGVLRLDDGMIAAGARPCWMPYFYTPDVDGSVAAIVEQGGQAQMPPMDLPAGRIAMVADPQGVPIYLMNPTPPAGEIDPTSDVFDERAPQRVRWNELSTPDDGASMQFYAAQFGFEFNDSMPMGELGNYTFITHHGRGLGAVMPRVNQQQPPAWLFYFGVPSIMEAQAALEANGGTILQAPMEIPGGEWSLVALDPQGAAFGLVGPKLG
jgi:predicted enzyme related to lactoylglutathione lyase